MDPLLAAQVYNAKYSRLCSLPEELLLAILHHLKDDPVSLCCLAHVSRTLRRLAAMEIGWWTFRKFSINQQLQLRQLLRKDKTCDMCRDWRDWRDDYKLENKFNRQPFRYKFRPWAGRPRRNGPYCCAPCHTDHSIGQLTDRGSPGQCIGRRGGVQLCEHVSISWTTIERHILEWRKRKPSGPGS
ncbi:uncharacterized protein F4812DRAFT_158508 [Daldinia caldariorum]|uniref:uncharacterized protein n=1 Tax=Daldinia caldariorum TaxID=326644 RepID=UPI0020080BB4|nr:uncharacterized protein F4812DRAFT_158508 [Daldinia caldariorum]KAI1464534.1 hypothetical protein F4812DRAFT_158508 [Daldinia caldariorum]